MANKNLFASFVGKLLAPANVINEAGGPAYAFGPEHMLAQYAVTTFAHRANRSVIASLVGSLPSHGARRVERVY